MIYKVCSKKYVVKNAIHNFQDLFTIQDNQILYLTNALPVNILSTPVTMRSNLLIP